MFVVFYIRADIGWPVQYVCPTIPFVAGRDTPTNFEEPGPKQATKTRSFFSKGALFCGVIKEDRA